MIFARVKSSFLKRIFILPTHTISKKLKNFLCIRFMKKRLHHINSTQSRKQIPKNEIFFRARKKAWSIDHFNFQLNERCSEWIYLIQKNYFNQNVTSMFLKTFFCYSSENFFDISDKQCGFPKLYLHIFNVSYNT